MVVSPVSLTPEELQEQSSSRPKMPTLVGLGTAVGTPPLPEVAPVGEVSTRRAGNRAKSVGAHAAAPEPPARDPLAASSLSEDDVLDDWSVAEGALADAGGGRPDAATSEAVDGPPPEDITPFVLALANFALELSLGPLSRAWLPEVQRSAEALRLTANHRGEPALCGISERLLELLRVEPALPSTEPAGSVIASEPTSAEPTSAEPVVAEPFDGHRREQILHEVARLAGLLAEWPAHAQDLAEEARRRETRIVRELLANFDGIKRDHRARAEEMMRLEELAGMSAETLAEEFELPRERADELRLSLEAYRERQRGRAPEPGHEGRGKRALQELQASMLAFDSCDPEQKSEQRVLRDERRQAMTRVNLLLAERGELEWLDVLESLSFAERIERLEQWLESGERPT
jgi:hypothetical protein